MFRYLFLFELRLPLQPGNITFEIPLRELYCTVTISGLNQSIVNRRQKLKRSHPIFNLDNSTCTVNVYYQNC